ncbi:hypothetical protein HGP14_31535 [Rhizobium sp. P32RR-XVIII]|uniref:hypothetical protein n=1 Tax=Rhizobium sp. P32RR-XVIII TaxID=2726738 RepID=UPI001456D12B|nr:hypothetical protein [Rhizobium sp. P32RR-XVIII]NLS07773.1 hypothetical protein [Rhizobium sp. P32RR-XVIII]
MTINLSDPVSILAFDPSVRRSIQNLPQHQVLELDDRFEQLVSRLREAEGASATSDAQKLLDQSA